MLLNRFSHPQSSGNNTLPFFLWGTSSPLILILNCPSWFSSVPWPQRRDVWLKFGQSDLFGHCDWFKDKHVTQPKITSFPSSSHDAINILCWCWYLFSFVQLFPLTKSLVCNYWVIYVHFKRWHVLCDWPTKKLAQIYTIPAICEGWLCIPQQHLVLSIFKCVCQSEKWRQLLKSVPSVGPLFESCSYMPVLKVICPWPCFCVSCLALCPTLLVCLYLDLTLQTGKWIFIIHISFFSLSSLQVLRTVWNPIIICWMNEWMSKNLSVTHLFSGSEWCHVVGSVLIWIDKCPRTSYFKDPDTGCLG